MTLIKMLRSESASHIVWRVGERLPFRMPCVGSVIVQPVEDLREKPVLRAVVPYQDLPKAPESLAWDWNTEAQNEILGDTEDWSRYRKAHVWYDSDAGDVKSAFKLPVARMVDGELKVVWRGVAAAMGALMGARGGVDIPDSQRRGVYDVLAQHYGSFDKDPPEFRAKAVAERAAQSTGTIIHGIASSTSRDWHGTEMSLRALQQMSTQFGRGIPYLPAHDEDEWDEIIGRTIEATVVGSQLANNPDGGPGYDLRVDIHLYEDEPKAKKLLKRLKRGENIGMSVGGWFTELDMIENKETSEIEQVVVRGVELDHLATTRRPSNPDSWITELRSAAPAKDVRSDSDAQGVFPYSPGDFVRWESYYGKVAELFQFGIIEDVENGPFEATTPAVRVQLYDKIGEGEYEYGPTDRHRAAYITEVILDHHPIKPESEGYTETLSAPACSESRHIVAVEEGEETVTVVYEKHTEEDVAYDGRDSPVSDGVEAEIKLDKVSASGQDTHVCDAHRSASENNAEDYKEITAMSEEKTPEVALEHAQDPNVGSRLDALERSIEKIADLMVRVAEHKSEPVPEPVDERETHIASLNATVAGLEEKVNRLTTRRRGISNRRIRSQMPMDEYDTMVAAVDPDGHSQLASVARSQKVRRMAPKSASMSTMDLREDLADIISAALADGAITNPFV